MARTVKTVKEVGAEKVPTSSNIEVEKVETEKIDTKTVKVESVKAEKSESEKSEDNKGLVSIQSESRANKTIFAISGEKIVFDEKGIAKVNQIDADYLLAFPNVKKVSK